MGRTSNPDYFKVSGTRVEDRDTAAASRSQLTREQAELRREASKDHVPKRAPAGARRGSPALRAPAEKPAARATTQPTPAVPLITPAKTRAAKAPSAKPRHGQKRRSSQKRHEVSVVGELRRHPDESPAEAAYAVRHERPPADVIDVREGARRRAARAAGRMPPKALPGPAASTGLAGFAERLLNQARDGLIQRAARAIHRLAELVELPFSAARVIRDIRQKRSG